MCHKYVKQFHSQTRRHVIRSDMFTFQWCLNGQCVNSTEAPDADGR